MRRTLAVILIGAVLVFLVLLISGQAAKSLAFIQRPLVAAGTWLQETSDFLRTRSSLLSENQDLKNKLEALTLFQTELESLRDENNSLKLQLGYLHEHEIVSVLAAITTRSITPNANTVSIDKGADDGIDVGDPVIVDEGILLGKVISTTSKTSTIRLLSDRSSNTAATILNTERTLGLVEGSSGFLLDFRFIPQETELDTNDIVITSGLEEQVPYGLVIGIVNSITSSDTDPFKSAVIEPVIDYRRYQNVGVIIEP